MKGLLSTGLRRLVFTTSQLLSGRIVPQSTISLMYHFPFQSSEKAQGKLRTVNSYIDQNRRNFLEKEMETESS